MNGQNSRDGYFPSGLGLQDWGCYDYDYAYGKRSLTTGFSSQSRIWDLEGIGEMLVGTFTFRIAVMGRFTDSSLGMEVADRSGDGFDSG